MYTKYIFPQQLGFIFFSNNTFRMVFFDEFNNLITQTTIFMKWMYYNKIRAVRWFRAHNSPLRSEFWTHNSLIRSDFERTIVWTMVWVWSGPWLNNRLDNGMILVWSETVLSALTVHMVFRAHFSLIRKYFGLGWSDQRFFLSCTV